MINIKKSEIKKFRNKYLSIANRQFDLLLRAYNVKSIDNLLENEIPKQRIQQLTSIISPMNEAVLKELSSHFKKWKFEGADGCDSVWDNIKTEHKLSLGNSNSWTGHWYSRKVPVHLLMKLKFNGRKVSEICMFIVDLSECSEDSQWPIIPSDTSSFSSLVIHNVDVNNIVPIFGNLQTCRKWCKPVYESV